MPVVALTGIVSSGKSLALDMLKRKGACVYDADREVHRYYDCRSSEIYKSVKEKFPSVILKNNSISRARLRDIVLEDRDRLSVLEKIVHPVLIRDLREWILKHKSAPGLCVAEVALLYEKKLEPLFDGVIFLYSPPEQVIARSRNRFNLRDKGALKLMSLRKDMKEKMGKSDFVVINDGSIKGLEDKVNLLWKRLKQDFLF